MCIILFHYFSVKHLGDGDIMSIFDQQHGVRINDSVYATQCIQMRSDIECMIHCSNSLKCCSATVTIKQTDITCCNYDVGLVDLQGYLVEDPTTSLLTVDVIQI